MEKFDHVVSLGYNCEIANSILSLNMRDAAYPFDWNFSKMKKINETLKNKRIIPSGKSPSLISSSGATSNVSTKPAAGAATIRSCCGGTVTTPGTTISPAPDSGSTCSVTIPAAWTCSSGFSSFWPT